MSKYHAKACWVDGKRFASMAEAARYVELRKLEDDGAIIGLRTQAKFDLAADIEYVADFMYYRQVNKTTQVPIVEDVKGFIPAVFRLKARLFADKFGHPITIVKMKSKQVGMLLAVARGQGRMEEPKANGTQP